jgi:hypothetical protein
MNETISELSTKLTYEQIISITQNPLVIFILIFIWLFPILLYILVGALVRGKTSSGVKLKSCMLSHANAWIPIVIWTFIQGGLFLILIFPFWANVF